MADDRTPGDFPLHKAPDGLLGAFDLKTLGHRPDRFAEAIQGTTDVTDFYFRDLQTIPPAVAGNMTNPGDGIVMTVPAGVVWRMFSIGIAIFTDAADVAIAPYGRFDLRTETGATLVYLAPVAMPARQALYTNGIGAFVFQRPLLLKAGSVIGYRSETQYTAPALGSLNLLAEVIPL